MCLPQTDKGTHAKASALSAIGGFWPKVVHPNLLPWVRQWHLVGARMRRK